MADSDAPMKTGFVVILIIVGLFLIFNSFRILQRMVDQGMRNASVDSWTYANLAWVIFGSVVGSSFLICATLLGRSE